MEGCGEAGVPGSWSGCGIDALLGVFGRGGRVAAKFDLFANGKAVNKSGHSTSRADVVDILSIVYWLRSRQLEPGKRFCFEMFHRRRLWRLGSSPSRAAAARWCSRS